MYLSVVRQNTAPFAGVQGGDARLSALVGSAIEVLGCYGDELSAFALVFPQALLDLAEVVSTFVDREANLPSGEVRVRDTSPVCLPMMSNLNVEVTDDFVTGRPHKIIIIAVAGKRAAAAHRIFDRMSVPFEVCCKKLFSEPVPRRNGPKRVLGVGHANPPID
ncbi:MAG: hypothetical protein ACPH5G_11850 [Pseudooceanicola atlanticus]